jgi:hypothetical protein
LDRPATPSERFYVAGGAWHGNDTIWRMIYDLNLVIQCVDGEGVLHPAPQRAYICLVDGLVSGEGNGPLQPLPKETYWLAVGEDPFAVDAVLTYCMGFAPDRVPLIAYRGDYLGPGWGQFVWPDLPVSLDERVHRLAEVDVNFRFAPPPGWRTHVER